MDRKKWLIVAVTVLWTLAGLVSLLKQPDEQPVQNFPEGSVILAPEQVQQLNDQTQELLEQLQRLSTENRKLRLMNQQLQQATKKPICA